MNLPTLPHLSEAEVDRLTHFLESVGSSAMNLEAVDGFFFALICGPDLVPPSEYLPIIWGEEFAFEDPDEAHEIISPLVRHWNTISATLRRTLDVPGCYFPILFENEDGVATANDWATGFMRGVQTRPERWKGLLYSEDHGGCLLPMLRLANEHHPDPALRPPPIPADKREEIVITMIAGLTQACRYYENERGEVTSNAPSPVRRTTPKVGPNDPCLCNSGRKFKLCCGVGPVVH